MSEYVIMPKADYVAACDAIRAKTGKTDLIKSGDMEPEILGITTGGGSSADVRYVTFMNDDGTVQLGKKAVAVGDDCADPIARGVFPTPTKESTAQYNYTFYSWATTPNGAADANWNKAVTEDRIVYANFIATARYCTVRFFNGDTLLQTVTVHYGGSATYTGDEPVKEGEYEFTGWSPEPTNVTADMDCYAQFKSTGVVSRKLVDRTLSGDYTNYRVTTIGESSFHNCDLLKTIDFPNVTTIGKNAFNKCERLTTASIPNVEYISERALTDCKLSMLELFAVTHIGKSSFQNCGELEKIDIHSAPHIMADAFRYCDKLTTLILRNKEQIVTMDNAQVITNCGLKSGYVYVPRTMDDGSNGVEAYKAASNWAWFPDIIRAIEDYPEICGGED